MGFVLSATGRKRSSPVHPKGKRWADVGGDARASRMVRRKYDNPPRIKALAEVRRLTAMVAANFAVLNIRPGAGAYGVTPAHVAIQKRDNAVFAFWRSEPNRILRVLEYQPSLRVLFDSAIRRFLIVTSIWRRREEQRAPWQQRSSRKSCLEHLK
jgi:hypothetical protein